VQLILVPKKGLAYILQAAVWLASQTLLVPYEKPAGAFLFGAKKATHSRVQLIFGAQEGTRTPTMLLAST
jgi:hypothetical protein